MSEPGYLVEEIESARVENRLNFQVKGNPGVKLYRIISAFWIGCVAECFLGF